MFTVAAMPVKYVGLLLLFAWCAVWCVYELTRPQDARQRVSNVLHLAMAVVMLLMVDRATWMPLASVVGIPVLAGFFALATGWFVVRAIESRRAPRPVVAHLAGHAAMFGAMTWHLAAMGVKRAHMGPDMPRWVAEASRPGGELWIAALVGVPFMAYLLVAAVNDVRRAARPRAAAVACGCGAECACGPDCGCDAHVPASTEVAEHAAVVLGGAAPQGAVRVAPAALAATCHEPRPVGSPTYRLSALADFAMNAGMFWMSTGLMVPLLPFFALLSF